MIKTNTSRIILVCACILIIIGVFLAAWLMASSDDDHVIDVYLKDGKTEIISFERLALVPGESCEYLVRMKSTGVERYDMSMLFEETGANAQEESNLKHFAKVKIISGDRVLCDKLLSEAFEDGAINLEVDFSRRRNTEFRVIYYLPLDVGNEAKSAETFFNLKVSAENK